MSVSTLYKADTLEMGKGSFIGLCQKRGVEISRMGTTFGVSAVFPVLSISHFGQRSSYDHAWLSCGTQEKRFDIMKRYMSQLTRRLGKDVKLVLPAMQASSLVNVSRAVGLGGGEHEVGHIIFDMAGTSLDRETYNKIDSELYTLMLKGSNSNVDYWKILPKWVNICADIRLECMLRQVYPESYVRLQSLAEWVWELESKTREELDKLGVSALGMVIRDLGFNHKSKSQNDIFSSYKNKAPKIWKLALELKGIWGKLQVVVDKNKMKKGTDKEIDKISAETVHLPLLVACQLLNRLHDLKQEQQTNQPPQPPQEPQDQPQEPQEWVDDGNDWDEDDGDDWDDDVENDPNDDQDQPNTDEEDDCNGGQGGEDEDKDKEEQDGTDSEGQDGEDGEDGEDKDKDGGDEAEDQIDDGDDGDDGDKIDDGDKTDDGDDVESDDKTTGGNSPDKSKSTDDKSKPSDPSDGKNSEDPVDLSNLDRQPQALNIGEAFQNEFNKLKGNVNHLIYIDNGMPVIELARF